MTQQVDWNWQIQNIPAAFPVAIDNYPTSGPYDVPIVYFENATGLSVDHVAKKVLALAANLTQWGVVDDGLQSFNGPKVIWGQNASILFPWGLPSSLTLIMADAGNPGIGFYSLADPDHVVYGPDAGIQYIGASQILNISTSSSLHNDQLILTSSSLFLQAGQLPSSESYLSMSANPPYFYLLGPEIQLLTPQSTVTLHDSGLSSIFDLSGVPGHAFFSVGGTLGVSGTTVEGDTVKGGIITAIGGSGSLSGDVTGSLAGTTLHAIQGHVVLASSPGTGNVLTYNGTNWVPAAPAAGGVSSVNNSDGTLTISPTTGSVTASLNLANSNTWTSDQAISPSGGTGPALTLHLPAITGSWLLCGDPTSANCLELYDGFDVGYIWIHKNSGGMLGDGDLEFAPRGGGTMFYVDTNGGGGVRSVANFSAQGDAGLAGVGHKLSFFGATYQFQLGHAAYVSGFTPNTSANFLYNESTWDGGLGGTAYTVDDLVRILKSYGLAAA